MTLYQRKRSHVENKHSSTRRLVKKKRVCLGSQVFSKMSSNNLDNFRRFQNFQKATSIKEMDSKIIWNRDV